MGRICDGCRYLNDDLKTCSKGLNVIDARCTCESFQSYVDVGLTGFENISYADAKKYRRKLRKRRQLMEGDVAKCQLQK